MAQVVTPMPSAGKNIVYLPPFPCQQLNYHYHKQYDSKNFSFFLVMIPHVNGYALSLVDSNLKLIYKIGLTITYILNFKMY